MVKLIFLSRRPIAICIYWFLIMESVFQQKIRRKYLTAFIEWTRLEPAKKGGFGLGLSLAKQIVDALKGTITVKDNKPKGTIFEVKIAIHTPSKKEKIKNIAPVGAIFWIYLLRFRLIIDR